MITQNVNITLLAASTGRAWLSIVGDGYRYHIAKDSISMVSITRSTPLELTAKINDVTFSVSCDWARDVVISISAFDSLDTPYRSLDGGIRHGESAFPDVSKFVRQFTAAGIFGRMPSELTQDQRAVAHTVVDRYLFSLADTIEYLAAH